MRPGNNPIEAYKAAKGGDGLRIRDDLPRFVREGAASLTAADKELLKWVGVFFRKPTPGKFMMRIRMPNGFATSDQLAAIADVSAQLGNGTLDITTRQQIELRGYTIEGVPAVFERLRAVDLRSLQTGMDNIRNLNGCPLAGLSPAELLDASPIVLELDRRIVGPDGNPEFTNLPRKMNITVTGCPEKCTHPEARDVAQVPAPKAVHGTIRYGFHALVGGKMGSGGFTRASDLGWFIESHQAVDVVLEIIRLFRDEGPRDSRTKCRLAFFVADWGLDRIRAELVRRLGWTPPAGGLDARGDAHEDHLGVAPQKQPGRYSVGVSVTVGRIGHEPLRELARLAREYGTGHVRLTTGQNAILVNVPQERLSALLREPLLNELSPEPSRFTRGLVSCTGVQYCSLAVIETKARAVQVAAALEQRLGPDGQPLTIYWSGCPAACGNHLAADIGLRGMKVNVGGQSVDAVAIYVGGRTGPSAKAGQPIMEMVPCDEALPDVLATIVKHLELFKRVEPQPGAKDRVLMVPAEMDDASGVEEPAAEARPVHALVAETMVTTAEPEVATAAVARESEPSTTAPLTAASPTMPTAAPAASTAVCRASELAEGVGRLVTVGGKSLALFRHDGRVVAVDAECPHEGGPLQEGTIEQGCVVCPWHAYRFDVTSGRCETDPSLGVRTYPTTVKDDVVHVEVP
jgi:ferredoxin-nitrite reductase